MKKIAIIGFGFCGRIAFANLVKNYHNSCEIIIFDGAKENSFKDNFHSAAFSNFSPYYILNVIAKKMSAFCDDEKHFCSFLQQNHTRIWQNIGEFGFSPRQIYGEYIKKITDDSFSLAQKKGINFGVFHQEVAAVRKKDCGQNFILETSDKQFFEVDEVILATSFKQSSLPFKIDDKNLVSFLWSGNALDFHQKTFNKETICLIGSGLTAVDVIIGLKKRNFAGKIIVISRRGNLPKKHFPFQEPLPNFIAKEDSKKGVLFLCLKIRQFLRQNPHFDLRHVVHSIKAISIDLWHNFDEKNKKLFLRLMPYWSIFRHRAPSVSISIIEQMIQEGSLEIKSGGIVSVQKKGEKFLVETKREVLEVDYLVNSLGFEFKAEKYPLLKQMLEENLLKSDLLMVQSNNNNIHLLGGLNIGRDFECTSVPDMLPTIVQVTKNVLASFEKGGDTPKA